MIGEVWAPRSRGAPSGRASRLIGCILLVCLALPVWAEEAWGDGEAGDPSIAPEDLDVRAAETLDVGPLNRSMEGALAAGQLWPTEPFAAAAMLTGFSGEVASLSITGAWAGPEGAGPLILVTISDGFLDDSVRGEWRRYVFDQRDDGTWHISAAERAWRCWRGDDDGFGIDPCP
jgi:hypothetical protein